MTEDKRVKSLFLGLIDGFSCDDEPKYKANSFALGLCKLDFKDNILHVHLRRPGLLIGKGGVLIENLKNDLGVDIHLHTVNLLDDK